MRESVVSTVAPPEPLLLAGRASLGPHAAVRWDEAYLYTFLSAVGPTISSGIGCDPLDQPCR